MSNTIDNTENYLNINQLTTEHYRCYQMQYNSTTKNHQPIFIGMYQHIPIHVIQIFGHLNYICHLISHLVTQEEIDNNVCRLISVDMVLPDADHPTYSYEMVYRIDSNTYHLQLTKYTADTNQIIRQDKLDAFPGSESAVEYLLERFFELNIENSENIEK